ncbi:MULTISPECIES: glycosyltransferase [Salinibaculum]|uniref:glycosyltransferase n=1 Tax=Salinibaculum TaxID=2732368 RepID=UPI0030CB04D1
MESETRLAFYVPSLTVGGAQRVTVNLANGFAERGVNVDLLVSYRRGELVEQVKNEVTLVDLQTPRIPLVGAGASIPALVFYLRKDSPDILFSQMHYANVVSVVADQLAAGETKLVLTEHTMFGQVSQQKDRLMFALARRLHPLADHILAVSSGVAESLQNEVGISDDKLTVINNPVVTPAVRTGAEASADHPWFNTSHVDVALGVGRLAQEKDFETLTKAIAIARETSPSLHLVILGEGPRRETLETLAADLGIEDKVSFPGYVKNPYAYMRCADIFVLSSRREGLPTALVEAMACGCPVVATDCRSGPREILADGTFGPLVPVGDARALAAGIEDVLREPASSKILKERAEDFSVNTVLNEYEHFVNRIY